MVEHTAHIRDVNGSIPLVATPDPVTRSPDFFYLLIFFIYIKLILLLIFLTNINPINTFNDFSSLLSETGNHPGLTHYKRFSVMLARRSGAGKSFENKIKMLLK